MSLERASVHCKECFRLHSKNPTSSHRERVEGMRALEEGRGYRIAKYSSGVPNGSGKGVGKEYDLANKGLVICRNCNFEVASLAEYLNDPSSLSD